LFSIVQARLYINIGPDKKVCNQDEWGSYTNGTYFLTWPVIIRTCVTCRALPITLLFQLYYMSISYTRLEAS